MSPHSNFWSPCSRCTVASNRSHAGRSVRNKDPQQPVGAGGGHQACQIGYCGKQGHTCCTPPGKHSSCQLLRTEAGRIPWPLTSSRCPIGKPTARKSREGTRKSIAFSAVRFCAWGSHSGTRPRSWLHLWGCSHVGSLIHCETSFGRTCC